MGNNEVRQNRVKISTLKALFGIVKSGVTECSRFILVENRSLWTTALLYQEV